MRAQTQQQVNARLRQLGPGLDVRQQRTDLAQCRPLLVDDAQAIAVTAGGKKAEMRSEKGVCIFSSRFLQ